MKMKYRKSEAEKIHQEIFAESLEHKYYTLGVAQGISFVYNLISTFKDMNMNFTPEQWMETIKNGVVQDDKVNNYFQRLIKSDENTEYKGL